jgi:dolichol-phosphate mannosyltransferase
MRHPDTEWTSDRDQTVQLSEESGLSDSTRPCGIVERRGTCRDFYGQIDNTALGAPTSADTNCRTMAGQPHSMPTRLLSLGVVTPLGNERSGIKSLMDEVLDHLQPHDRWYCVLDNVSTDGTREIVAARAKFDERVVCVWAPQNTSVVDAYFAGYEAAYAAGCSWILEMDAGFSHPPSKIPDFIAAMAAGYDYVGGSRFMPGGAHCSPWTRRCLSYGGTLLARTFLGSKMTDMTSGYECFNRLAMEYVLQRRVRSRANFFQTEIRHMMHRFRWKEIPIVYVNNHSRVGRRAIGESLAVLLQMTFHK